MNIICSFSYVFLILQNNQIPHHKLDIFLFSCYVPFLGVFLASLYPEVLYHISYILFHFSLIQIIPCLLYSPIRKDSLIFLKLIIFLFIVISSNLKIPDYNLVTYAKLVFKKNYGYSRIFLKLILKKIKKQIGCYY